MLVGVRNVCGSGWHLSIGGWSGKCVCVAFGGTCRLVVGAGNVCVWQWEALVDWWLEREMCVCGSWRHLSIGGWSGKCVCGSRRHLSIGGWSGKCVCGSRRHLAIGGWSGKCVCGSRMALWRLCGWSGKCVCGSRRHLAIGGWSGKCVCGSRRHLAIGGWSGKCVCGVAVGGTWRLVDGVGSVCVCVCVWQSEALGDWWLEREMCFLCSYSIQHYFPIDSLIRDFFAVSMYPEMYADFQHLPSEYLSSEFLKIS
ncbi:hypothetical protein HNY73_006877 [Argiope bruennichi]|uniref:Uncharacterized protein n=1 Tax=Argiope bruennichi TaxID=94029 RepID=A0A8T0FJC3_ARGBR|nr:hypothetical protein HNY73_006877 [Argiope bruennichi]